MALAEGQAELRGLVMGRGTPYTLHEFNPFQRSIRAPGSGDNPWGHGSWSGAEWMDDAVVPFRIIVDGVDAAGWLAAHQQLVAAFRPVGAQADDVELRFRLGGADYVMFGRPRMVDPRVRRLNSGRVYTRAVFLATDPLIYSGDEQQAGPIGLPSFAGGLAVPFTLPAVVPGELIGGAAELVNTGTAETGLRLRIDGPVPAPRVTVQRADGAVQTLRWAELDLAPGQWLDVDTAAGQAFLNGLPHASRHPGFTEWPQLPPGVSVLRFAAAAPAAGTVTATYRNAWW